MCGITGCLELRDGATPDRASVERMTRFMSHRGPDGEGIDLRGPLAFGHRRLSIIDLAQGAQPMWTSDGRYGICFNGEIYNYLELRQELESRGHVFLTHSDTEVLLHALIDEGSAVLPRLNGMFAFGFYDSVSGELLLARDHLGIKPLFYYQDNDRLLFASDLGALACHAAFPRELEPRAVSHYLSWRVVPDPYSAYRNAWQLSPGHYLKVSAGGRTEKRCYWEIPVPSRHGRPNPDALQAELEGLLEDALRLQVRSDVPVGAFLSGGVDSSTVAYWMAKAVPKPMTFTIGFRGADAAFDESAWAEDIASRLGTEHHMHVLKHYAIEPLLESIAHYFSQPCATGIPNYFVSALARRHVKVALAGVGGDECFAGYGRFAMGMPRGWLARGPQDPEHAFLRSLVGFTDRDKRDFFTPEFMEATRHEPSIDFIRGQSAHVCAPDVVTKLCYMDLKHFMLNDLLFNLDKMSMAHSLEVRVPLLDYRIVELAMRVPSALKIRPGLQKILLKRAMFDRLPSHVFLRPKKGFSLPKQVWVPKLEPFIRRLVNKRTVENRGLFRWDAVEPFLGGLFGRPSVSWKQANDAWSLFSLELWAQRFLDRAPPVEPPEVPALEWQEAT